MVKLERRMSDSILHTVDRLHASVISTITCITLLIMGCRYNSRLIPLFGQYLLHSKRFLDFVTYCLPPKCINSARTEHYRMINKCEHSQQ